jgi:hypothetical protein
MGVPYPNHGEICNETRESLNKAEKRLRELGIDTETICIQGSNIPRSRNAIINFEMSTKLFQKIDSFDYFLSLDADVAFNPEDILSLINRNLQIVSGSYKKKDANLIVGGYFDNNQLMGEWVPWSDNGLKKVDWVGGGFLLMKKEVLEKMEFPWFRYEIVRTEEEDGPHQVHMSDDLGFCRNAKRCGIDIYLDCDCKVQHIVSPYESSLQAAILKIDSGKKQLVLAINKLLAENAKLKELNKDQKTILT